jgi:hypothetical protein
MNELIQARRLPVDPIPGGDVNALLRARLPKEMHGAIEHAHGTEDQVYAPSPSPRMLQGLLTGAATSSTARLRAPVRSLAAATSGAGTSLSRPGTPSTRCGSSCATSARRPP